jgi:hypothetical protein
MSCTVLGFLKKQAIENNTYTNFYIGEIGIDFCYHAYL